MNHIVEDEEFEELHPRDLKGRFTTKRRLKQSNFKFLSKHEETMFWWTVEFDFPNINQNNSNVIGHKTRNYNCIAFAFGDQTRWWWPDGSHFWPKDCLDPDESESFEKLFRKVGAKITPIDRVDKIAHDPKYVTLAIYADEDGAINHLAVLNEDNTWTSKLGANYLIEHEYDALTQGSYGDIVAIAKIPVDKHSKMRSMK